MNILITDRNINNKILACLLLTLFSCQSPLTVTNKTAKTTASTNKNTPSVTTVNNSSVTLPSPAVSSSPESTDPDEELIKDIIKNSPDFFPGDINSDISESQATVPNNGGVVFATVPNNGGVVFVADTEDANSFGTKALIDRANLQAIKERIKDRIVKKLLPKVIKKTLGEPKKQITISFSDKKTKADVTIKTIYQRELLNRTTLKVIKKIKEESVIKSVFIKENSVWKLNDVSPIDIQPSEEQSNLKFENVKLIITPKDNSPSKTIDVDLFQLRNKNGLIKIAKGDIITLEVKATSKDTTPDHPLQLFVRLSTNNKLRIPLYDDGSEDNISDSKDSPQISGDATKNDSTYTGNIVMKSKVGVNYLTIDISKSGSENDDLNNFTSVSKSIPIIIN